MFKITRSKGFHLTFDNGITISTQFGAGNYCEKYNEDYDLKNPVSKDVEVAIWNENEKYITGEILKSIDIIPEGDGSVIGYVDINQWLKILDACRNWK